MAKITLNSVSDSIYNINSAEKNSERAEFIKAGRMLTMEHARKGKMAIDKARGIFSDTKAEMTSSEYRQLNERFQHEHLLYAAAKACEMMDVEAPANFDEFKAQSAKFYRNDTFYKVLQGIYEEIITPILPAVYSTAVDTFADVIEVGFGETAVVSINSNDIPIFQDSAWGASRSVPRNRFYAKDITLNPQPKTAAISAKWHQLVGNNVDFGAFFANLTAGMYAKTMGMWNEAMTTAIQNTALVPAALSYAFSSSNWITLANKLAAVNNTGIGNIIAYGGAVALSKVLPNQAVGSPAAPTDIDAALTMMLGGDYNRAGYLGEFMGVRLAPLQDAIIPNTQNTSIDTILDQTTIYMMAASGRKPLTIAYNSATPIQLEIDPYKAGDFELGINLTIALDIAAVFASKIGVITIS